MRSWNLGVWAAELRLFLIVNLMCFRSGVANVDKALFVSSVLRKASTVAQAKVTDCSFEQEDYVDDRDRFPWSVNFTSPL